MKGIKLQAEDIQLAGFVECAGLLNAILARLQSESPLSAEEIEQAKTEGMDQIITALGRISAGSLSDKKS